MSADRIRELNDRFRKTMATFSDFNTDNDSYEEHDFGLFTLAVCKFFLRIEHYDAKMEFGLGDPADPAKTTRVLTIMLAEEY